jgi:hypothetical protein
LNEMRRRANGGDPLYVQVMSPGGVRARTNQALAVGNAMLAQPGADALLSEVFTSPAHQRLFLVGGEGRVMPQFRQLWPGLKPIFDDHDLWIAELELGQALIDLGEERRRANRYSEWVGLIRSVDRKLVAEARKMLKDP